MKLLFDQNLSPRLVTLLGDLCPNSKHVRDVGLSASDDIEVWEYAAFRGYVIVSKDSDFHQRSFVFGSPPKIVWIRRGNCSTSDIEDLIRRNIDSILAFAADTHGAFLAID